MLTILIIAVYFDIKTGCIPNKLNLSGCILGLFLNTLFMGKYGLINSICGILLPIIILFVFFVFRVLGAGDIKLLSVIGAFRLTDIICVIMLSFVLAALWGLLSVVFRLFRRKKIEMTRIPMSVSIVMATGLVMLGGGEWNGIQSWVY